MESVNATREVLRVASFNLKRDFGLFLRYRWETRRELAASIIRTSGASIIGVQELLPHMRQDIIDLLPGYSIYGQGRMMGQKPHTDEHSDIIIKNSEVELSNVETFWISKNPSTVSRAYFAMFPRICTVAELRLRKSGRLIRVFNTHFDHVCSPARRLGVQLILDYINNVNKENPMPTIIMGDFNARLHSSAVRIIRENRHQYSDLRFQDVYGTLKNHTIGNTYHGLRGTVHPKSSPIDYIFVSEHFEILDVSLETANRDGIYPSDHYPVLATLCLP